MLMSRLTKSGRGFLFVYAAAYAGSASLQKGVGFVLFMWLAHSLSVAEYARFGLFYALQTGVAAFALAGIAESVVGMLKEHHEGPARGTLFAGAFTVFGLLAVTAAGGALIVYFFMAEKIGASGRDIAIVTIAGLLSSFFALQSLFTRLEENHGASLSLSFFPPLAGLLGGCLFFLVTPSVSAFYLGMAGGLATTLGVYLIAGTRFEIWVAGPTPARDIIGRLGPFILIVALAWLSGYGNTYLVRSFFEASDVARFTFAFTLSSIMQLLASSLNQVWAPKFYRLVHEKTVAVLEQGNRQFYRLLGLVLGGIGGLVLMVVPVALGLAGPSMVPYTGMELELFFLFAAYAVSIPWWNVQNYYLAHSRGREMMFVILATSALGVLVWLTAIWLFGAIGVYAGLAMMALVRTGGAYLWARRSWPLQTMWEGTLIACVLLAAGAVASFAIVQAR